MTALHGLIIPDPAATAAAPPKNPLHNDLMSYLGVLLLSPTTTHLLKKKLNKAELHPDKNVFTYPKSAYNLNDGEFIE